jgi:hypothetical protein
MIGLLLIYFIGKAFYELAHEYDKNRWLFAIFGVVAYYIGTFIGGIILGIIGLIIHSNFVNTSSNWGLGLLTVPFGLLGCWGFYKILIMQWDKPAKINDHEPLDSNLI